MNRVESIGYEGKTIHEMIRIFCWLNIEAVLDVRANPVSQKQGFSKRELEEVLKM